MDSTLAAGIVGGTCAIAGSIVSHVVMFILEQRKTAQARQRVSLESALVFLEKCKIGKARRLEDDDYYALIRTLAALDPTLRRAIIEVYQSAANSSAPQNEIVDTASKLQAQIASALN